MFCAGSDWEGAFDYIGQWCEVVYLPRTEGVSSTQIRDGRAPVLRGGVVGRTRVARRFCEDSRAVGGVELVTCCPAAEDDLEVPMPPGVEGLSSLGEMLPGVDAVFLFGRPDLHAADVSAALRAGKHVFIAGPAFLSRGEATAACSLARELGLTLFQGVKTLWFPAFERLLLLVRGGVVGRVLAVDASCSQVPEGGASVVSGPFDGALCDWGATALLPAEKLLGTEPDGVTFSSWSPSGADLLTRVWMDYGGATASVTVGRGVKTEGDLVVTGTDGYVYVPAPWWLTDYFEVRREDLRDVRKEFAPYAGEGMRHGLLEFVRCVRSGVVEPPDRPFAEVEFESSVFEGFFGFAG